MAEAAERNCLEGVPRRVTLGIAVAAGAIQLGLLWLYYLPSQKVLWGDENTYWRSALALLGGDPAWRPEPLWPAGYPRFIAGIAAVSDERLVAVQLVQTALLVIAAVLLADVVCRVAGSRFAGVVAGALVVTFPPLVAFAHYLWPEVLHLALFMVALWVLVCRPSSVGWCVVAGVAVGLALITKSLLTAFVPVLVVVAFARRPAEYWLLRAAVFLLALCVTIAPAVLRQHRDTGRWMIADSSAFNLWVGLNDISRRNFDHDVVSGAYREYIAGGATFTERDAVIRQRITSYVNDHSWTQIAGNQLEKQYFRLLDKDSYLTDQLPGGAAVTVYGAGYLSAGPAASRIVRRLSYIGYAVLLVAAPLGFALWTSGNRRWVRGLLLFVLYNLAIFLWLHVKTRFRVQMLPVVFMGVGFMAAWLEARWSGRPVESPKWRWAVAVVAIILLEFFAFAGPLLP